MMMWSLLGCFGTGEVKPSLDSTTEPKVVLADAGLIFGVNKEDNSAAGWRLDESGLQRFEPKTQGTVVAGATTAEGVAVVVAQKNRTQPQLWTWSSTGWEQGPAIPHGKVSQILVASDGALWTEGDSGVHRSGDNGATWTRMNVPNDLQLGAIKLGEHDQRMVFAGRQLMASTDNGQTWATLYPNRVSTTDGQWIAEKTSAALRIGRLNGDGITWTADIEGDWVPSAIAGGPDAVRVVATPSLSTQVVVLKGTADGKDFAATKVDTLPEWVGLGDGVVWVSRDRDVHVVR